MSTPLIVYPDVVLWAAAYLRTALASNGFPGTRVSDTYKGKSAREVWVQRDGGPQLDPVREAPRLRVNVFADATEVDALAAMVSALLRAGADGSPVCSVRQLTGPSPIADSKPRMYLLFELTTRGATP